MVSADDLHRGQLKNFTDIGHAYRNLADLIVDLVPAGEDREEALGQLRLSFVFAREGITRNPGAIEVPAPEPERAPKAKIEVPDIVKVVEPKPDLKPSTVDSE